jgi:(S)-ureidoglycine aminohydrolase
MDDRGRLGVGYTLITPQNHYESRLAGLAGATVVKLVTPRIAPARFGQCLATGPTMGEAEGVLGERFEHFLFGLAGTSRVTDGEQSFALGPRGFAYVPTSAHVALHVEAGSQLLWLKRRYEPADDLPGPPIHHGSAEAVTARPTATAGLTRRELIEPDAPAHDFNMSLMRFEPDVGLPQIEIHDEEHGLWMTAGGGIYHLNGHDHEVTAGDFIYMAPYCPQGFRAGPDGAEYLLYKDAFRDGF